MVIDERELYSLDMKAKELIQLEPNDQRIGRTSDITDCYCYGTCAGGCSGANYGA